MSRILVIGDLHGNLPAFEAVLDDAGEHDACWVVGDIVGYGPYPNECIMKVMGLDAVTVAGNHDLGALGAIDLIDFNLYARIACEWTGLVLDPQYREFLDSRPLTVRAGDDNLLVHGSPLDPVWEYVLSVEEAAQSFKSFAESICFHGHSHVPSVFVSTDNGTRMSAPPFDSDTVQVEEDKRYLINVGSVGQPRDGDPRACYVTLDTASGLIQFHRIEYPVSTVQERMGEVGLPEFLGKRLEIGS